MYVYAVFLSVCGAGRYRLADYVFCGYGAFERFLVTAYGKRFVDYDFGGASYGCESVGEGQKGKAAADYGCWVCGIFLLAAVFEKHFADCCRYYGIWIQYGGDLSDNGVILRQIDSEVFNGVEFYFDNGELWLDFDADDYRKDCGTCGYCVWNELDCRGRAGGFGIDCGS